LGLHWNEGPTKELFSPERNFTLLKNFLETTLGFFGNYSSIITSGLGSHLILTFIYYSLKKGPGPNPKPTEFKTRILFGKLGTPFFTSFILPGNLLGNVGLLENFLGNIWVNNALFFPQRSWALQLPSILSSESYGRP